MVCIHANCIRDCVIPARLLPEFRSGPNFVADYLGIDHSYGDFLPNHNEVND